LVGLYFHSQKIEIHSSYFEERSMMKFVLAFIALAGGAFLPTIRTPAQNPGRPAISDPAELHAYQDASTRSSSTPADLSAKIFALEDFLFEYPQSVAGQAVLDQLIDAYQQANDQGRAPIADPHLLRLNPNDPDALFISVFIKKIQCGKTSDAQTCDDAAALAQKGLAAPKPKSTSDDDWKKTTAAMYPVYHSAIALDYAVSKRDFKAAIQEYRTELMLYSATDTTKGPGLVDTLQLAETYAKPEARDMVLACWFYARAWNFASAPYQAQIETKLEYWLKRYHGNLDGLDVLKTAARTTLFPPTDIGKILKPPPSPAELAHLALTRGDIGRYGMPDGMYILANGTEEDAQRLWTSMQAGGVTPVPGTVLEAKASAYRVSVITTKEPTKPQEFFVNMTHPVACSAVPAPPSELKVKDAQAYLLANGVKVDTDAMSQLLKEDPSEISRISILPAVSVVEVAVHQEAKDSKTADFIVNMKAPVSCKEAPAVGSETKTEPPNQLNASLDKFIRIPPKSGSNEASVQIVMKDGYMQPEEKKANPAKKPVAGDAGPAALR
jgi:hypothetical protein